MPPAEQSDTPGESTTPAQEAGEGDPPHGRRMDPAPIPTQAQAQSPTTRANPSWSPRLGPPGHRRAPPHAPPPGRISPPPRRLRPIRSRTLKSQGQLLKENQVKKKAALSNSEKTENRHLKKREH